MKSIAQLWTKSQAPRKRTSRYSLVNGHIVLKQNTCSMADGEPSVLERETKGTNAAVSSQNNFVKRSQRAGRDYDHQDWCQVCADGGTLVMCDWCPCAYHLKCLGVKEGSKLKKNWSCPHHQCQTCGRKANAVGGLLFRCEVCPAAFCEDDLPQIARDNITKRCERFVELGQIPPKQACFMLCSEDCIKYHAATNGGRNPEYVLAAADRADDDADYQGPLADGATESLTPKPDKRNSTGTPKRHKASRRLKHAPVRTLTKRSCRHAVRDYKDQSGSRMENTHKKKQKVSRHRNQHAIVNKCTTTHFHVIRTSHIYIHTCMHAQAHAHVHEHTHKYQDHNSSNASKRQHSLSEPWQRRTSGKMRSSQEAKEEAFWPTQQTICA